MGLMAKTGMMMCDGGSNELAGRRTLKVASETKMAVAIGIILYSSSVIVVGCGLTY
jgi:hypothetical protein